MLQAYTCKCNNYTVHNNNNYNIGSTIFNTTAWHKINISLI